MDDIYKDYYHQTAPLFDTIRLDKEIEISGTADIVQSFVKKENGIILDIGCGTGRYSAYLQRLGYAVIGIDTSPEQLQYAASSLSLICGSATDLPFEDNYFTCCLMILVLQQLNSEQRIKSIYEAYRVLKEEGVLVIKTRSHEDIYKYPFKDAFPSAIPVNLERYPAVPLLTSELETMGFKGIDTIPMFSEQPMKIADLMYSIRHKHNTTLALIPPKEFEAGYLKLERLFTNAEVINVPHYHTILIARKLGVHNNL